MHAQPRVVVTRRHEQAGKFCDLLSDAGMTPILFPTIQLKALPAPEMDQALAAIDHYDWIIFSSPNAVDFFFNRVGKDLELPKTAVVGSATARRLGDWGFQPDFIPDIFTGEALALGLTNLVGQKVLLPRAGIGRTEIIEILQNRGAEVTDIPLYDTVTAEAEPEMIDQIRQGYEAVTFASPSSVEGYLQLMDGWVAPSAVVACIGPVTAKAARKAGLAVTLIPDQYTVEGMALELSRYFHHKHKQREPVQVKGA